MFRRSAIAVLLAAGLAACTDVGSFTTDPGECYRGKIVAANFVRQGFEPDTYLSLTLDTDALGAGTGAAGVIWSSDGRFLAAPVAQLEQVAHDSLALLQFPGGRIRNYLAHAAAVDGSSALVVISLMENDKVEVRVLRPVGTDPDLQPALFGIFDLELDGSCSLAPTPAAE
jgi:hypothetical protein